MKKRFLFLITSVAVFVMTAATGLFFFFTSDSLQPRTATEKLKVSTENTFHINTNLLQLEIKKIPHWQIIRRKRLRGGGIARIGNITIIQTKGIFFHLDLKTQKLTQLNIMPPKNGLDAIKINSLSKYPKHSPSDIHYKNILIIKRPQKTILLVSHNHFNAQDRCYSLRLSRIDFPADLTPLQWKAAAENWTTIFKSRPCIKKENYPSIAFLRTGGGLVFSKKPDHVFLGIGDFGIPKIYKKDLFLLQNAKSDYGRILEINIDTGKKTRISIGHRNPQGIVFDDQGRLWSVEQGPRGGDELNLIVKGKNYGWPLVTYGTDYGSRSYTRSKAGQHKGYEKPIFAFVPSVATSDITFVQDFAPEWNGDFLIASLKGQSLFRMRLRDGRVIISEKIHLSERIRNIYSHGDGTLIALGLSHVFIIKKSSWRFTPINISDPAVQAAWNECIVCHDTGKISNGDAPALGDVWGRRVGKSDFANYSPAMKRAKAIWTKELLLRFLRNPNRLFEGTTMPKPNFPDNAIRRAIVNHLETLKDQWREKRN